ncbi:hypothetical protein ACQY0O_007992 [Thecaphora frezii]
MPHSHHSHSGEFCMHAKSHLSEVVSRAYQLGFTHFHLSEHVPRQSHHELYPEELEAQVTPQQLRANFDAYLREASRIRAEHERSQGVQGRPPMHILVGCETENIASPETLDYLVEVLEGSASEPAAIGKGKVDYLVGSVHHSHGVPIDFDPPTFERALDVASTADRNAAAAASAEGAEAKQAAAYRALILSYLDTQLETMQKLRPEVIGHFDLFRLYRPETTLDSTEIWSKIERNVRYAVEYGALFECNAAAFRKGWKTAYPGREVLDLILSLGGRLCLSDDSHGVHAVAFNYHRLRDYLVEAGVQEIWYLERATLGDVANDAKPPTRFARGTVAKKLGTEWKDHPFWTTFDAIRRQEEQE